jgi:hypothetical protein
MRATRLLEAQRSNDGAQDERRVRHGREVDESRSCSPKRQPVAPNGMHCSSQSASTPARSGLRGASESTALRERHAAFYASVADRPDPELMSAGTAPTPESAFDWSDDLRRVEAEYDILRSMLAWWLESGRPERALRSGANLRGFWMWRGLYSEGSYWLETFLELDARYGKDSVTPPMRARVMHHAGLFASRQGKYTLARERFETAAAVWRAIDDRVELAYALSWLGLMVWLTGDAAQATALLEQSRRTLEVSDDEAHLSMTLRNLGLVARS